MFQQAESEGVQPNHNNSMPNSISEEPINELPSNLGGSSHQSDQFFEPEIELEEEEEAESEGVQPNVRPSSQSNSSSEEPIHQLPSNLGASSHQSDRFFESEIEYNEFYSTGSQVSQHEQLMFYTPNSSVGASSPQSDPFFEFESEPKISVRSVHPNVNQGGRVHHPKFTETQIADNYEIGSADHLKYYRSLHNAAKRGDWESAKSFIEKDSNALAAKITVDSKTVFHVAALCDQWEFILKLLELVSSPESIAVQDKYGKTVLHYVAQAGSLKTAKALVQKNVGLPQIVDSGGDPPLFNSIWSESKELVWYLSLMPSANLSPRILRILILSGYHDIALYFVQKNPKLALAKDGGRNSLLYWLATNPSYFVSGSNLGLIERWIYKCVKIKYSSTHSVIVNIEDSTGGFQASQPRSLANRVLQWFKRLLCKAIVQLAPSVNMVRDAKLTHECAVELVNHVCTQLSNMSFREIEHFLTKPKFNILDSAIKCGIEEIVRTLLLQFPDLINVRVLPDRNILQAAIEYRQENIVNMIKEISTTTTKHLGSYFIESKGVTLNLAGKLAPAFKLFSVSGAALQMQRELQWFKEVEEITFTYQREWRNTKYQTPKDVFRTEHSELAEQGEKWMKDTANSCMLVSTLIATVLFAAAFTVPGGNGNDSGIAIFLRTNAFMIFAISNALGLFSSLTSLLMFLAILTARYEVDDFLKSLPKKLIIGLGSLFIAIAAMIIAFGATLTIVLGERWHWVFVPITLVAFSPVTIFVLLQLPLFVQMVRLTYGASIFRPWP